MKLQDAVKKETVFVAAGTAAGTAVMILAFYALNRVMPESVPFHSGVILGGICGCAVAVLNFFLMAVTVQKVANTEDQDTAYRTMKLSYRNRMLLQLLWVIVAIAVPVFQFAAGILPLMIPSLVIKAKGVFMNRGGSAE
ncbi:MAG: ATP synthase subunit I [Lachnospiraceae bacterium]|nr:ATP synthase subunit I [Lachnospiraceae bacterium]